MSLRARLAERFRKKRAPAENPATVYAWVTREPKFDADVIVHYWQGGAQIPLYFTTPDMIGQTRGLAKDIAAELKRDVRLVRLVEAEEIEKVEP